MSGYIYASDPHGRGDEWISKVREEKKRHPNAQVVLGGDYIDRGLFSLETLEFVYKEVKENGAIALLGNHEDMFLDWYQGTNRYGPYIWFHNGGMTTLESLLGPSFYSLDNPQAIIRERHGYLVDFIKELPLYYMSGDYFFTHAGVDLSKASPEHSKEDDFLWARDDYIYKGQHEFSHNPFDKHIVTGHTPTSRIKGRLTGEDEVITGGPNNLPIEIAYKGEYKRIFTDGGAANRVSTGNVIYLEE